VRRQPSSRSLLLLSSRLAGRGRTPLLKASLAVAASVLTVAIGRWTTAESGPASTTHRGTIPAGVTGNARVLDGDTIDIRGVRIRLFGIDAPELHQSCNRPDGGQYACGDFARGELTAAIGGSRVTCSRRDVDRFGRMVGVCSGPSGDLGEILVTRGAAMAYRHYSLDYVDEEERARNEHAGIWQGSFEPPWDFRHDGSHRESPAKHTS
jgi:endonuclease YncB( thermonuclease family)